MVGISLSDLDKMISEYRETRSVAKNRTYEREIVDKVKEYEKCIRDEFAEKQQREIDECDKVLEVLEALRSKVKEV